MHTMHKRGEGHHNAKLSEADVKEMRDLWNNGIGMSQTEIAKIYGIRYEWVCKICNRKAWAHVD